MSGGTKTMKVIESIKLQKSRGVRSGRIMGPKTTGCPLQCTPNDSFKALILFYSRKVLVGLRLFEVAFNQVATQWIDPGVMWL